MRRGVAITAIVIGLAGAAYCALGIVMNATFTESETGVLIFLALFIVCGLVAAGGIVLLRRVSRNHGAPAA